MNSATPFPWPDLSVAEKAGTGFRSIFEHAPVAVARCNSQGMIIEMNSAFRRTHNSGIGKRSLRLDELVRPEDWNRTEALLRDLFTAGREHFSVELEGASPAKPKLKWTAWRQAGCSGVHDHALIIAEQTGDSPLVEENSLQTQRWQAVGRLTGGVVHDFNNLLTGVMLYCDLLLTSLDTRDRRRRYADEIRSAVIHATGLVRQLLVFARPQATAARLLGLNEVAVAMQDLLSRLIGENIALDLRLDPELGAVKIDPTQVQQILLNLVLNARDALAAGGRITVETSNCRFQPVAGTMSSSAPAFPCVLLVVGDNGHGMDAETRQHLFEPFFTTKNEGEGTGLGLTTVHSIVTTNRGLIHVESEPGQGTRVMILLPRAFPSTDPNVPDTQHSTTSSPTPFQKIKKEKLL